MNGKDKEALERIIAMLIDLRRQPSRYRTTKDRQAEAAQILSVLYDLGYRRIDSNELPVLSEEEIDKLADEQRREDGLPKDAWLDGIDPRRIAQAQLQKVKEALGVD